MYKCIDNGFSILIPTLNSSTFLNKCIESVGKYTELPYEVIVHINGNDKGTLELCAKLEQEKKIIVSKSNTNLGVCGALNRARKLANKELLMYINDDHVVLPGWDTHIRDFIKEFSIDNTAWISGTMIEPVGDGGIVQMAPLNYGRNVRDFQEARLLNDLEGLRKNRINYKGANWPPTLLHTSIWDAVGGYSEEYFPGSCSDADLAKKMYDIGCRTFVGVGKSLSYHFVSITRNKVPNTVNGRALFIRKYGIDDRDFLKKLDRAKEWSPNEYIPSS